MRNVGKDEKGIEKRGMIGCKHGATLWRHAALKNQLPINNSKKTKEAEKEPKRASDGSLQQCQTVLTWNNNPKTKKQNKKDPRSAPKKRKDKASEKNPHQMLSIGTYIAKTRPAGLSYYAPRNVLK